MSISSVNSRDIVIDAITAKLGVTPFDEHVSFEALQLDELDVVSIMLDIQTDNNILLFDSAPKKLTRVIDLIDLVEKADDR